MKPLFFTILFVFIFIFGNVLLQNVTNSYLKTFVLFFCAAVQILVFKFSFPDYFNLSFSFKYTKLFWIIVGVFLPIMSLIFFTLSINYFNEITDLKFEKGNLIGKALGALYVGITEEVFMRGVLFLYFTRKTKSLVVSVIISSFVFTLFHAFGVSFKDNPLSVLFYFSFGLTFAIMFIISNSIWVCIIAHSINNLIWAIFDFETKFTPEGMFEVNMVLPAIFPLLFLSFVLIIIDFQNKRSERFLQTILNLKQL